VTGKLNEMAQTTVLTFFKIAAVCGLYKSAGKGILQI